MLRWDEVTLRISYDDLFMYEESCSCCGFEVCSGDISELPVLDSRVGCNLNFLSIRIGFNFNLLNLCNLPILQPRLVPDNDTPGYSIFEISVSVVNARYDLSFDFGQLCIS